MGEAMTSESYKIGRQQQVIATSVAFGGAVRTLLAGPDANRVRIRFSQVILDDFAASSVGTSILYPGDSGDVVVGVLTGGHPQCELSLEEHGQIVYGPFFETDVVSAGGPIGVVSTRIIDKVEQCKF